MKLLVEKVIIIIIVVLEVLGFSQTDGDYRFRNEILNDINYQRELTGLNELALSFELCEIAEIRATEIADTWSHNRPDGSKVDALLTDFTWKYVGENLAKCYSGTDSHAVILAWINSDLHRQNLLNSKFSQCGIGIYEAKNTVFITLVLTD